MHNKLLTVVWHRLSRTYSQITPTKTYYLHPVRITYDIYGILCVVNFNSYGIVSAVLRAKRESRRIIYIPLHQDYRKSTVTASRCAFFTGHDSRDK